LLQNINLKVFSGLIKNKGNQWFPLSTLPFNRKNKMRKPLKVAAWSGIILFIVGILSGIIQSILEAVGVSEGIVSLIGLPFSLVLFVCAIFFNYGFVALGKRFKNNLLVVMAWIGIVLVIIMGVLVLVGGITSLAGSISGMAVADSDDVDFQDGKFLDKDGNEISPELAMPFILAILMALLIIFLIIVIPLSIYTILWGVALIKLDKNKVPLAKATGVVSIVAGATYIILIGFVINIAVVIMEIIMLFKSSEKYEWKVVGRKK